MNSTLATIPEPKARPDLTAKSHRNMYLIRTNDPDSLHRLAESLDALDDFTHCDLGELNTLELTELCDDAAGWISAQPFVYDEANGLAIFAISPSGVAWLCDHPDALDDYNVDTNSLAAFGAAAGAVYALDTF
ncbi:MAG: hypothetical protein HQ582_30345 [Planctomycetes bacterium]|nr:hypothetical protein [Planctomycetota bacterium]